MKFEDEFLTIEQSKELKELGIDFSNANYCFRTVDFNNSPSWKYIKDDGKMIFMNLLIFINLIKTVIFLV